MPDTFTSTHRAEITALAALHRLPAVYPFRLFAELGGLLSYGNDLIDDFGRAANYADRILRGANPSELPGQFQSNSNWWSISKPPKRSARGTVPPAARQ